MVGPRRLAVSVLLLVGLWVWHKGRKFAAGDVFRASRLSSGNHLFPTQVLITPTSVVQYTPRWIGRQEQTIHMAHVSSVNIETGMILSDVLIETSGGSDPIVCHGHRKGDARRHEGPDRSLPDRLLSGTGPRPCRRRGLGPISPGDRWTI